MKILDHAYNRLRRSIPKGEIFANRLLRACKSQLPGQRLIDDEFFDRIALGVSSASEQLQIVRFEVSRVGKPERGDVFFKVIAELMIISGAPISSRRGAGIGEADIFDAGVLQQLRAQTFEF